MTTSPESSPSDEPSQGRLECSRCGRTAPLDADSCPGCGQPLVQLQRGSLLASRYEIVERLGAGAMGVVYKAWDRMLEELVALKVRRGRADSRDETSRRFRNEIKLARKVSHPNVCRIHDYGEHAGYLYLSMSLLEGTNLAEQIERCPGGLPPREAFDVAIQIAEGLSAIHAIGILHRDLKAANILRDVGGVVQVTDFGVAKDATGGSKGITATGMILGTPEYMSPEQCRSQPLDLRSDVYSFGILLWEIFTGELPFRGDSLVATLFKHVHEPPPFEGPPAARLPRAIVPVLEKALQKSPDRRQPSIQALKAELQNARAEVITEAAEEPPAQRPRKPLLAEMRAHERFDIPIHVRLQRIDEHGAVVAEELAVSDNISRGGACLRTAMPEIGADEALLLREVDGDFETRIVVRSRRRGKDGILRIGVQFVERLLPDRLLPWAPSAKTPKAAPSAVSQDQATVATVVVGAREATEAGTGWDTSRPDRREHSRYAIHLDLSIRLLDEQGNETRVERTISENFSRGGARVLTAFGGISPGDELSVQEVGGDFRTRAVVRHVFTGDDGVLRLGLEFLDGPAPRRLVPDGGVARRGPPS